jgi:phosphohistidine phosphatase
MQVILIRHGKAEAPDPKSPDGKADEVRPLTKEGKKRMRQAAHGLVKILPKLDVIAHSPLERARQTADIVAAVYADHGGEVPMVELPEMAPGKRAALVLAWLQNQPPGALIALVGHEPNLSRCAGLFVAGKEQRLVEMKKGAACLVDFPGTIAAGKGLLKALVQPAVLRAIRGK